MAFAKVFKPKTNDLEAAQDTLDVQIGKLIPSSVNCESYQIKQAIDHETSISDT